MKLGFKATTAKYRSRLPRPEGHRRQRATSGANHAGFRLHFHPAAGAERLATLAALGVVLELFFLEKFLFARAKDELLSAIDALQQTIDKNHNLASA